MAFVSLPTVQLARLAFYPTIGRNRVKKLVQMSILTANQTFWLLDAMNRYLSVNINMINQVYYYTKYMKAHKHGTR